MKKVYEKALRMARAKVFDNPKYEKIILFCKYKLGHGVFKRVETTTYFQDKFMPVMAGNPKVTLVELPSTNFDSFLKSKEESKTVEYHNEFIFK